MTKSIIPEVHWSKVHEEVVKQYTMCVFCGPNQIPDKVFFIKGTSYCSTHAHEIYNKYGAV